MTVRYSGAARFYRFGECYVNVAKIFCFRESTNPPGYVDLTTIDGGSERLACTIDDLLETIREYEAATWGGRPHD
jgi:hypothetical protein